MVNRVMILGSINVDSIYQVTRFPQPGETIAVKQKSYAPGGKGANQAVAAARSGAKVSFIGAVGADNDGQEMVKITWTQVGLLLIRITELAVR